MNPNVVINRPSPEQPSDPATEIGFAEVSLQDLHNLAVREVGGLGTAETVDLSFGVAADHERTTSIGSGPDEERLPTEPGPKPPAPGSELPTGIAKTADIELADKGGGSGGSDSSGSESSGSSGGSGGGSGSKGGEDNWKDLPPGDAVNSSN